MPRLVRGFTPSGSNIIKTLSSTLNFQMDTGIAGSSINTISVRAVTANEAVLLVFKKEVTSSVDVTLHVPRYSAGSRKRCGRITAN